MPGPSALPFRPNDPELRRVVEQVFQDFVRRDKADRKKQIVETSLPDRHTGSINEVRLLNENNEFTFIVKDGDNGEWKRIGSAVSTEVATDSPSTQSVTPDVEILSRSVTITPTRGGANRSAVILANEEAEARIMTNDEQIEIITQELIAVNALASGASIGNIVLVDGGTY